MSESTCLHIQDRESGPIRVVELPWISVRIGRAAYCEVQLPGHDLADEACRLQRRGRSWHLVPAGIKTLILFEGRSIDEACQLPFDAPFTIGSYCLTLRRDRAAEPDWEMYRGPAPPQLNHSAPTLDDRLSSKADPERARPEIVPIPAADLPDPLAGFADRTEPNPERARAPGVKDRWEARWRAAGAELKARAEKTPPSGEPKRPAYRTGFDSVPLKGPRVARTPAVTPPRIDPTIRPIPTPVAARIEPSWNSPSPEPGGPSSVPDHPRTTADAVDRPADTPPPHPFEQSDFENRLELAISDAVGHEMGRPQVAAAVERGLEIESSPAVNKPACDTSSASVPNSSNDFPPLAKAALVGMDGLASIQAIEHLPENSRPSIETYAVTPPNPPFAMGESVSATQQVDGPTEDRLNSEKKRNAAQGARVVGKAPAVDKVRSSRRGSGDPLRAESNRASSSRGRLGAERRASDSASRGLDGPQDHAQWPSVQDILASHRPRPNPAAPPRSPVKSRERAATLPSPTLACEPGQWRLPLWLAWPPLALLILCAGSIGCVLSWSWAGDSYSAAIITSRLILADATARHAPLPESVVPPRGTWIETSAQHLAHWAIYLNRFERQKGESPQEIRGLLERALQASPINPTARLALAQLDATASETPAPIRNFGLSRDLLSLAWTGRRLLEAGKKDAALKAYRRALEIASRGDFSPADVPRFNDDQAVPRYLLPGEDRIRDVVGDLIERDDWTVVEWTTILPGPKVATLATARLLRQKGRIEVADALLDTILSEPKARPADGTADPLATAARAEALALRSRWQEAYETYHAAIESLDDATLKRAWWFNMADIAIRLPDDTRRQAALRATLTVSASDDISRRATEILRAFHARHVPRSTGTKAN